MLLSNLLILWFYETNRGSKQEKGNMFYIDFKAFCTSNLCSKFFEAVRIKKLYASEHFKFDLNFKNEIRVMHTKSLSFGKVHRGSY